MVVLEGGAVFYERGTPVRSRVKSDARGGVGMKESRTESRVLQ